MFRERFSDTRVSPDREVFFRPWAPVLALICSAVASWPGLWVSHVLLSSQKQESIIEANVHLVPELAWVVVLHDVVQRLVLGLAPCLLHCLALGLAADGVDPAGLAWPATGRADWIC